MHRYFGCGDSSGQHEMVYHDVKQRTRSDSIYSEFNEEDYDDGDVSEAVKPQGAATFASYMNLTNTCIGAVSHSSTHSLTRSFIQPPLPRI
jgi:hypothetical protein